MKAVFQIAQDVLLEARRSQLFWLSLSISLLLIFVFFAFSSADPDLRGKLFVEGAMTLLWAIHLILCLFFVTESIYAEMSQKTLYYYLVRNLSRFQYVLGKFFGFFASISLSLLISGATFLACFTFLEGFQARLLLGLVFLMLEMGLVISILIFFSMTFTKLVTIFGFIFLLFFMSLLEYFLMTDQTFILIKFFLLMIPNLKYYSYINMIVHAKAFSLKYIAFIFSYTLVFCTALISGAVLQFERKVV
jgi:ABC-type transport system involved in multi-copper enzyme maturation permease subunit